MCKILSWGLFLFLSLNLWFVYRLCYTQCRNLGTPSAYKDLPMNYHWWLNYYNKFPNRLCFRLLMQSLLVVSLGLSVLIYPFENECNNIHLILLSCSIKPLEILINFLSKLHTELVIQNLHSSHLSLLV